MVDRLYDISKKLDEGIAKKEYDKDLFSQIIAAAKKGKPYNENRLAGQLIAKYFKNFPDQGDQAFESLVDLCEIEEDKNTVITGLRSLSEVGKNSQSYASKATYVYAQIIQSTTIQTEIDTISNGLEEFLNIYPDILSVIFKGFVQKHEEKSLTYIKRFLFDRDLRSVKDKIQYESNLSDCVFQYLRDFDPKSENFKSFVTSLTNLSIFKSTKLCHKLLDSIVEFESSRDKNYTSFDLFLLVLDQINKIPAFYSDGVSPSKAVNFFNKVISARLKDVEQEPVRAKIFQIYAEISPRVRDDIKTFLEQVYKVLNENLPAPIDSAKIYFSSLEPLLYSFHHLGFKLLGHLPSLCGLSFDDTPLTEDEKEKKEILKKRLSFIYINSNKFLKSLNEKKDALKAKDKDEKKKIEKSIAVVSNVKTMVDLLNGKKPKLLPSSNIKVVPSWVSIKPKQTKQPQQKQTQTQNQKKESTKSPANKKKSNNKTVNVKKRKSLDNQTVSQPHKKTNKRISDGRKKNNQSTGQKSNINDFKIVAKLDGKNRR